VPEELSLARGDFVFAPIGKQMKLGVVWSLAEAETGRELKSIADRKATRALPPELLDFVEWTARYNGASPGNVLRMVIRSYKALDPSAVVTLYRPSGEAPIKLTASREAVLQKGGPWPARASEAAARAGVSSGVRRAG